MNRALVLGLSIHGLAVCRALSKAGVPTTAIAAERTPTCYTKFADVILNPEVNSPAVVDLLLDIYPNQESDEKIVLFPTNDNMVRELAIGWSRLEQSFAVSWSGHLGQILELQRKDRLPEICQKAGVLHPKSLILDVESDVFRVSGDLGYPCIVKPARPLSSFKVEFVSSEEEFLNHMSNWSGDFPLVAQQFVNGGEESLLFYSAFWVDGEEVGAFTGRKIQSMPRGMGQGTVLEGIQCEDVLEAGRKFAKFVKIDGPIAVEFKKESADRIYMIEPNVGRSEYCVDLLIQSGFNLPLIEYAVTTGIRQDRSRLKLKGRVWYDTERDKLCYVKDVIKHRSLLPRGNKPIFPFVGHRDTMPIIASSIRTVRRKIRGGIRRILNFLPQAEQFRL